MLVYVIEANHWQSKHYNTLNINDILLVGIPKIMRIAEIELAE